jgi:hypothetical protein
LVAEETVKLTPSAQPGYALSVTLNWFDVVSRATSLLSSLTGESVLNAILESMTPLNCFICVPAIRRICQVSLLARVINKPPSGAACATGENAAANNNRAAIFNRLSTGALPR